MLSARLGTFALALLVVLFATGCEDPSNVGLDVVGEIGGDPEVRDVFPFISPAAELDEVTGQNSRILVGQVDDPLLGAVRTNAYLDFGAMVGSAGFREGTVSSAWLELPRDYLFGDTLGMIEVHLYDMSEEWTAQGATSDTTITPGAPIGAYTISAQDTLVTLPLPSAWIAANDTTLRSAAFSSVFHGFHLEARSGNTVLGFATGLTRLRAVAGTDSVHFPQNRNLTTAQRLSEPAVSESHAVLQATAGPILSFDFDFTGVVGEFALNRATIRIQDDSLAAAANLPPNFVRTRPASLALYFRNQEGNLLLIENAARDENGHYFFRSGDLYFLIDQLIRELREPGTFEIRVPANPNTLHHVLVRTDEAAAPRLRLVLTPLLD